MICARCDRPIFQGEKYEKRDFPSASGPGATINLHAELCERVLTQTAPVSRPQPIRE